MPTNPSAVKSFHVCNVHVVKARDLSAALDTFAPFPGAPHEYLFGPLVEVCKVRNLREGLGMSRVRFQWVLTSILHAWYKGSTNFCKIPSQSCRQFREGIAGCVMLETMCTWIRGSVGQGPARTMEAGAHALRRPVLYM